MINIQENINRIRLAIPEHVKLVCVSKFHPVEDILTFEAALFEYVDTKYPEIPEAIRTTKEISEDTEKALIQAIEECKKSYK